jgi:hypothetical protein
MSRTGLAVVNTAQTGRVRVYVRPRPVTICSSWGLESAKESWASCSYVLANVSRQAGLENEDHAEALWQRLLAWVRQASCPFSRAHSPRTSQATE